MTTPKLVIELARPVAWARGVHQPSSPHGPDEYDLELVAGDDQPAGDGWFPLYREAPALNALPLSGEELVTTQLLHRLRDPLCSMDADGVFHLAREATERDMLSAADRIEADAATIAVLTGNETRLPSGEGMETPAKAENGFAWTLRRMAEGPPRLYTDKEHRDTHRKAAATIAALTARVGELTAELESRIDEGHAYAQKTEEEIIPRMVAAESALATARQALRVASEALDSFAGEATRFGPKANENYRYRPDRHSRLSTASFYLARDAKPIVDAAIRALTPGGENDRNDVTYPGRPSDEDRVGRLSGNRKFR